ncbi:MAG: hypothetical protein QXW80_04630 [Candidatus Micrarchaeia archaeon]
MSVGGKGIKMLLVGIDTYPKTHFVEIQNQDERVMWREACKK